MITKQLMGELVQTDLIQEPDGSIQTQPQVLHHAKPRKNQRTTAILIVPTSKKGQEIDLPVEFDLHKLKLMNTHTEEGVQFFFLLK